MMQYLGCHLVDLVVRLCGVPNEIIPLNTSSNINGINANDIAFAVFKYSDIMATIKSSLVDVGGFSRRHFTVNGQNGSMHIVPLEKSEPKQNGYLSALSTKAFKCSLDDTWGAGEKINYEVFDRYQNMLRTFADIIKGKRDYFVDLETEARVQRCMLSATGMKCDYKGKINL
jgi:predicted dehydrogenase